ncbi:hypothetical protein [Marispirochaeta sp.]|uniref:hypothetical protein n=1 Tax=Marispirochaeta sp. TaxID=2038653 RepID=UPI0029C7F933|nr:hypothetical protein [Marispirochaeta sp.]
MHTKIISKEQWIHQHRDTYSFHSPDGIKAVAEEKILSAQICMGAALYQYRKWQAWQDQARDRISTWTAEDYEKNLHNPDRIEEITACKTHEDFHDFLGALSFLSSPEIDKHTIQLNLIRDFFLNLYPVPAFGLPEPVAEILPQIAPGRHYTPGVDWEFPEKYRPLWEEIFKEYRNLWVSLIEPPTVQQQRQEGILDGLRAVDEILNQYFDWQRVRPILIETGTITPAGDHYRFTRNIPRKYLATALYSVARVDVRRNTNGAKRSAQQTIREVFLDLDGKNFNRSFWESDFHDPPDLDKIKNDTAREIIEKLQSVQH